MYSPKIREELIPRIYHAAKEAGIPMTRWVNQAIEEALPAEQNGNGPETSERKYRKEEHTHE